jgi:hypothetical protein
MRVPREKRVRFGAEVLRRLAVECKENDYRKFLLTECIEAYLNLDEKQRLEFAELLQVEPYKEIQPMMMTTFEKGVAKGLEEAQRMMATTFEKGVAKGLEEAQRMMATTFEKGVAKGREEGQRQAIHLILERRFGPLSSMALQHLEAWPSEQLQELLEAAVEAPSLKALGLED